MTNLDKIDIDMENSAENDTENHKYKSNKSGTKQLDNKDAAKSLKASNKLNKLDTDSGDGDSPSIIKTKKCVDMDPPMSSQIQMTIWKEDSSSQIPGQVSKNKYFEVIVKFL